MASPLFPESGMRASEGPLPLRDLFPDDAWTAKLAIAPGTVYGNAWEQRESNSRELRVLPVDYTPPWPRDVWRPTAFISLRSGGVELGRVELELRPDVAPLAVRNFLQLCQFGVYKAREAAGRCEAFGPRRLTRRRAASCTASSRTLWCRAATTTGAAPSSARPASRRVRPPPPPPHAKPHAKPPECFDLSLVPYAAGGRSIYSDRPDGLFVDESPGALSHARGSLSMSNNGAPDSNGSQFFICITPAEAPPRHLDGQYTVFGQVVGGFSALAALSEVGRKDGTTRQRVVVDSCGVLRPAALAAAGAGLRLRGGRRGGVRAMRPPPRLLAR